MKEDAPLSIDEAREAIHEDRRLNLIKSLNGFFKDMGVPRTKVFEATKEAMETLDKTPVLKTVPNQKQDKDPLTFKQK